MQQAITEIMVLFVIMFFGYVLRKKEVVDERMVSKLSTLVLSGTLPALIIVSMNRDFNMDMFRNTFVLIGFTVAILLIVLTIIEIEVRKQRNKTNEISARHFLMMFGNTSFMGIPVLNALYGSDGVFYAATVNIVFNFLMFTYGIYILRRNDNPNLLKSFMNPGFWSTIIGFVLFFTPLSLPYIISRPLAMCGNMTIPLALLIAGSIISRNKLSEIIRPIEVWYTSIIRIVIYPIILIPILMLIGVDHFLLSILVIIFSTPAPLTAGAFVEKYGGDSLFASKVVVLSNLLSLITMTGLIYIFTEIIV